MKNRKALLSIVYLAVIAKILIYGSSSLFTKRLLNSTDVLDVISLRFLISSCVFSVLLLFKVIKLEFKGKDVKSLLFCSLFEPILYFVFETLGISMSTTIIVGVITALGPISSCIVEMLILKEKTTTFQKICLLIGVSGVILIVLFTNGSEKDGNVLGVLFMVLAIVSGSLFSAFSRKSSKEFKPMEITCISAFIGAFFFNSANAVRHVLSGTISTYFKPFFSLENMKGFLFLAVISTIIATGLNNFALSKIQISNVASMAGISTVYTIFLGVVFNNEILHIYHIVGTILILVGVFGVNFLQIKSNKKKA